MSTKIETIAEYLDSAGLKYDLQGDKILTGFGLKTYRDRYGKPGVFLAIVLHEGGNFLQIVAPYAYTVPADHAHRGAFFEACARVSYRAKMLRFAYDEEDGEVRISIEMPLMDNPMSKRQFMRAFMAMPELIEDYDRTLRGALETGEIKFYEGSRAQRMIEELGKLLRGLRGESGDDEKDEKKPELALAE